jgi:hypothetical protein
VSGYHQSFVGWHWRVDLGYDVARRQLGSLVIESEIVEESAWNRAVGPEEVTYESD